MDPEERLFAALSGGKPDRIPSFSLMMDPNIYNQVLGREPSGVMRFLSSDFGSSFVDRHAGAISKFYNAALLGFASESARINYLMGFDGIWFEYWRIRLRNHAEFEDAFGRLHDIVDDGYGNPYFMYRDGLVKSPEDWRNRALPGFAEYAVTGARMYRILRAVWRKKIAIIPFIGPGLWENSWQPMGFATFVSYMRKDPAFVREMVDYYTTLAVSVADAYCRAGARVLSYGDDLAYKSGPMISPAKLEELYGDGYRRITETVHRYGARIYIHCCGNTNDLVEKFVEWGFDGAHAFEPTADNDLAEARGKVGDRLCLVGNIDVTHILVDATKEEVEEAVRKAVEDSAGGGFILAPTHTHASINVQNVRWMMDTARKLTPT
jgi:uroporphyrinogen decarboxylase